MANPASSQHSNRLARETSPYLLQHQHNPVDWYAWGPEALGRAFLTDHLLAFEITSIVLLVAAVGGVVLGAHARVLEGDARA